MLVVLPLMALLGQFRGASSALASMGGGAGESLDARDHTALDALRDAQPQARPPPRQR
jgi:hypothetical protein